MAVVDCFDALTRINCRTERGLVLTKLSRYSVNVASRFTTHLLSMCFTTPVEMVAGGYWQSDRAGIVSVVDHVSGSQSDTSNFFLCREHPASIECGMHTNQHPEIHAASQLIRTGRFLDAATILRRVPTSVRRLNGLADALLADVLQRIGQNLPAEEVALRQLRGLASSSPLYSRYHFVLGNVQRERGNTSDAVSHLQLAAGFATDLELTCWSQLRLVAAIAEANGVRTAIARLDEVKRTLARFGDSRPFAALHLWLVEAESTERQS